MQECLIYILPMSALGSKRSTRSGWYILQPDQRIGTTRSHQKMLKNVYGGKTWTYREGVGEGRGEKRGEEGRGMDRKGRKEREGGREREGERGRGRGRERERERERERVGVKTLQMTERSQLLGSLAFHPEPELSTVLGNSGCLQALGCL
jgi:hypothetical protein